MDACLTTSAMARPIGVASPAHRVDGAGQGDAIRVCCCLVVLVSAPSAGCLASAASAQGDGRGLVQRPRLLRQKNGLVSPNAAGLPLALPRGSLARGAGENQTDGLSDLRLKGTDSELLRKTAERELVVGMAHGQGEEGFGPRARLLGGHQSRQHPFDVRDLLPGAMIVEGLTQLGESAYFTDQHAVERQGFRHGDGPDKTVGELLKAAIACGTSLAGSTGLRCRHCRHCSKNMARNNSSFSLK